MKRKIVIAFVLTIIFSAVLTVGIRMQSMKNAFDEELYCNVIRLHILANSDSECDQQAKLLIRDNVLGYVSDMTADAENVSDAERILSDNTEEIQKYVTDTVRKLGYSYDVSVSFSDEQYPVRYYDGFAFPSGIYKSLKIKLGEARGKNWWCVLYPSVCLSSAEGAEDLLLDSGVSKNTVKYIGSPKKYKFEFYLLELLGL